MNKVIVTGANGFIGSSLIKRLVDENIQVLAIDISFKDSRLPESNFVTKIEMNLDNEYIMLANLPIDRYDAFYHFAWRGVNGIDKADPVIQLANAQMAVRCASVAQKVGCKKFLCAGTVAEQATNSLGHLSKTNGGMMYGVAKYCTHLMLETYCKNIGMPFVWMQFSNIYGPSNKTGNLIGYTLGQLIAGNEATFGPAQQPYDFVFVDDLLEAIYRIGKNDNKQNCYYIGSGTPRQLKEYLLEVGRAYGKERLIKIGVRPDDGIVYTMEMFDNSALIRDIGEYVSKSFDEGIRYTIDNY